MPLFMLMTKLAPNAIHDSKGRKQMGRAWLDKVHKRVPKVKFVAHYAIFGPYDFMDIYEAPDIVAAQRVALISRSEGAVSVETWAATEYDVFLKMLDEVD
jgi:uncharacterized protein with GYD domain